MNTPQTPDYGNPLIESSPEWQRARMLGRREALDILIEQNAEDFPDDFQQSRSLGDTGDFMTEWKVKKLEELFDAKEPSSLIEHLDSSRYEIAFELSQVTMERDNARAEIEAMREVIKEVYEALLNVSPVFGRTPRQDAALAKLQPFIKP